MKQLRRNKECQNKQVTAVISLPDHIFNQHLDLDHTLCNSNIRSNVCIACQLSPLPAAARRRTSSKPVLLTEAQKQLMVHKLPQVLRLHLKRFRYEDDAPESIRVYLYLSLHWQLYRAAHYHINKYTHLGDFLYDNGCQKIYTSCHVMS